MLTSRQLPLYPPLLFSVPILFLLHTLITHQVQAHIFIPDAPVSPPWAPTTPHPVGGRQRFAEPGVISLSALVSETQTDAEEQK